MTAVYFILMLCGIILIHEFGHFIVAKLFHVYVYEFAIGMGPQLVKWKGKETIYSIRLLPIGGYCSMAGEEQTDDADGIPENRLMSRLAGWKKICIMAAGPLMNFILAWVLFVGIYLYVGQVAIAPPPIINGVVAGSPAEAAGFQYGDEITKVTFSDGSFVEPQNFYDVLEQTTLYHDETVYTVNRGGESLDIKVTPLFDETEQRYMIGILIPEATTRVLQPLDAFAEGTAYFVDSLDSIVVVLRKLVQGVGMDALSGPVGIYSATEQQLAYGLESFLALVGLLSLNVGIMNLLPIPMFDGGRIVITLIEMIIRRRIPEKVEAGLMFASLLLVVALFFFVTWNDLARLL